MNLEEDKCSGPSWFVSSSWHYWVIHFFDLSLNVSLTLILFQIYLLQRIRAVKRITFVRQQPVDYSVCQDSVPGHLPFHNAYVVHVWMPSFNPFGILKHHRPVYWWHVCLCQYNSGYCCQYRIKAAGLIVHHLVVTAVTSSTMNVSRNVEWFICWSKFLLETRLSKSLKHVLCLVEITFNFILQFVLCLVEFTFLNLISVNFRRSILCQMPKYMLWKFHVMSTKGGSVWINLCNTVRIFFFFFKLSEQHEHKENVYSEPVRVWLLDVQLRGLIF